MKEEVGRKHPIHLAPLEAHNRPILVFVTACMAKRNKILATPEAHGAIVRAWERASTWLVGRYVILPDHVHLFCAPNGIDAPSLERWMRYWKSLVTGTLGAKSETLWQRHHWDRQLRFGESYSEKWEYVRNNPVRHRYVSDADDWPYQGELTSCDGNPSLGGTCFRTSQTFKRAETRRGRAEARPSERMKIYFVAGEASGDNHGAALMQSLRHLQPNVRFIGRGGPQMKLIAGAEFTDWSGEAGVVGLWEVIKHYPYFRRELQKTLREIAVAKPDAVVLIDYPGFNLRLARKLRRSSLGGKIIYYISPQVWAWNRGRIPKMARWLDLMLCIFPFEADLYARSGLRAVFVGHPMMENLEAQRIATPREPDLVGLFPGSRAREVRKLFPIMIAVMRELWAQRPSLRFEVAAASVALAERIRRELEAAGISLGTVAVVVGQTAQTMQKSAAGVVASGTATLEAAFFRLPFVLVYKVAMMTYLAGKLLVRVQHLGMPNVLANREIVPEFIQHAARPSAIAREILRLLDDGARREKMLTDFDAVIAQLGRGGANETAARAIVAEIAPASNA